MKLNNKTLKFETLSYAVGPEKWQGYCCDRDGKTVQYLTICLS